MRICLVTNLYDPYILGGAEISVGHLAEQLAVEGHDILIITTQPRTKADIDTGSEGITVKRFYPMNLYSLMDSKSKPGFLKPLWHAIDMWNPHSYVVTKKILQKFSPDIVNTHNIFGLSSSVWSAVHSLRRTRKRS